MDLHFRHKSELPVYQLKYCPIAASFASGPEQIYNESPLNTIDTMCKLFHLLDLINTRFSAYAYSNKNK